MYLLFGGGGLSKKQQIRKRILEFIFLIKNVSIIGHMKSQKVNTTWHYTNITVIDATYG